MVLYLVESRRKVGQQIVVPDPHGLEDADRKIGGLHDGKDDLKEHLDRVAAINHGRLLDLERDVLYKTGEHKDRQARAKAEVDKADVERRVEADAVRQIGQREHEHLEGHDHRKDEQVIEKKFEILLLTRTTYQAHMEQHKISTTDVTVMMSEYINAEAKPCSLRAFM